MSDAAVARRCGEQSNEVSHCQPLADFDELADHGGTLQVLTDRAGLPVVTVGATVRPGGCASITAEATVAGVALSKRPALKAKLLAGTYEPSAVREQETPT